MRYLLECSMTELGFVRILAQAPQYGFTVAHARTLLLRLLQDGVRAAKQITDRHLAQLVRRTVQFLRHWMEEFRGLS
jgi:hypothetical protein